MNVSMQSPNIYNPFAFKVGDQSMQKEYAAQYYPPSKRLEIRHYLSRSSIRFKQRPMANEKDIFCNTHKNTYLIKYRLQRSKYLQQREQQRDADGYGEELPRKFRGQHSRRWYHHSDTPAQEK